MAYAEEKVEAEGERRVSARGGKISVHYVAIYCCCGSCCSEFTLTPEGRLLSLVFDFTPQTHAREGRLHPPLGLPAVAIAGCERKRCSEAERAERARAQGKLSLTLMLARAFKAFGSFRQVRIFSASVEGVG